MSFSAYNPLNFGIKPDTEKITARKIRLINIIILLSGFISLFFMISLALLHMWINMSQNFVMLFILIYISYKVKIGDLNKVLRVFFIVFPVYFLSFVFIYGENGIKYYFISLAIMASLLIEEKKVVKRIFFFMFFMFLFSDIYPRFFPFAITNNLSAYFYYTNIAFSFLILFATISLYKDQQMMYETELQENNAALGMKNEEITLQNEEIASQRDNLLELNERINIQHEALNKAFRQITDSAKYARRIQSALLPLPSELSKVFSDSFVVNLPKNIVSGDFYWYASIDEHTMQDKDKFALLAVGDCTGHGIPGAFLTAIGINMLHQIVNDMKIYNSAQILSMLDKLLTERLLQQSIDNVPVYDGIDLALIVYFPYQQKVHFSGAKRPLFLFSNAECTEIKGSKHSIGLFSRGTKVFEEHEFDVKKGDMLYLFTDGYPDQTGGPKQSKFLTSNFREMIFSLQGKEMAVQHNFLLKTFENWKKDTTQTDDVMVIGLQI